MVEEIFLERVFCGITDARRKFREEHKEVHRKIKGDILLELKLRIKGIDIDILGRGSATDAFDNLCKEFVFLERVIQQIKELKGIIMDIEDRATINFDDKLLVFIGELKDGKSRRNLLYGKD